MRHSDHSSPLDHSSPFDREIEAESEMTQEFWGPSNGWQSNDERAARRLARIDDTGSLRAIRAGVAAFRPQRKELRDQTGEVRRTRAHGVRQHHDPSPEERRAQASIGDLAAGHYDDDTRDDTMGIADEGSNSWPADDIELTPAVPVAERIGLGGVDPLLLRLGVLVLVGILLVPLALSLRSSSDAPNTVEIETPSESVGDAVGVSPAVDVSVVADGDAPAQDPGAESSPDTASIEAAAPPAVDDPAPASDAETAAASASPSTSDAGDVIDDSVGDVPQSVGAVIDEPATVDAEAERVVPECPQTYEAAPGDSWYRIADAADVSPNALLVENRATTDTGILPGDEICLPSGATMPQPPSTSTPEVTTETQDTRPDTTVPATASTTTVAATPPGSPGRDASVDEVKAVIRSIFPESEWQTAFEIAQRESRFDPTADNGWCCHGVFQIYWSVHRSWLDDFGIDSADDLYDPLLNVQAAHAIWERSGNSWSAWSTYSG